MRNNLGANPLPTVREARVKADKLSRVRLDKPRDQQVRYVAMWMRPQVILPRKSPRRKPFDKLAAKAVNVVLDVIQAGYYRPYRNIIAKMIIALRYNQEKRKDVVSLLYRFPIRNHLDQARIYSYSS